MPGQNPGAKFYFPPLSGRLLFTDGDRIIILENHLFPSPIEKTCSEPALLFGPWRSALLTNNCYTLCKTWNEVRLCFPPGLMDLMCQTDLFGALVHLWYSRAWAYMNIIYRIISFQVFRMEWIWALHWRTVVCIWSFCNWLKTIKTPLCIFAF